MHRHSYDSVVDQMVNLLAEQRQAKNERQAAYVALARAILYDEVYGEEDARVLDAFGGTAA
jgi:hypothetical protein